MDERLPPKEKDVGSSPIGKTKWRVGFKREARAVPLLRKVSADIASNGIVSGVRKIEVLTSLEVMRV